MDRRDHRDERLLFTDSEPACRFRTVNPCAFPERPSLEVFGDGDGLLLPADQVLDGPYDSLLVQSTVWTDELVLGLEYRSLGLGGPPGPWVDGQIEVAEQPKRRTICTADSTVVSG